MRRGNRALPKARLMPPVSDTKKSERRPRAWRARRRTCNSFDPVIARTTRGSKCGEQRPDFPPRIRAEPNTLRHEKPQSACERTKGAWQLAQSEGRTPMWEDLLGPPNVAPRLSASRRADIAPTARARCVTRALAPVRGDRGLHRSGVGPAVDDARPTGGLRIPGTLNSTSVFEGAPPSRSTPVISIHAPRRNSVSRASTEVTAGAGSSTPRTLRRRRSRARSPCAACRLRASRRVARPRGWGRAPRRSPRRRSAA